MASFRAPPVPRTALVAPAAPPPPLRGRAGEGGETLSASEQGSKASNPAVSDAPATARPSPAVSPPSLPSPARGEGSPRVGGEGVPGQTRLTIAGSAEDSSSHTAPPPPLRGRVGEGGETLSPSTPPDRKQRSDRPAHAPIGRRTKGHVKALRAQMTEAEQALWRDLRGHRFESWSFRRQVPMGAYVADFVCHRAKLVIELDGGQHEAGHDAPRDAWFTARGYRVLRYWNTDVLGNRDGVLEDLAAQLARRGAELGCAAPAGRAAEPHASASASVPALTTDRAEAAAVSPPTPTLPRKGGGGAVRGREAFAEHEENQPTSSGQPVPVRRGEPSPLAGEGREGGETAGAGRAAEAHASASASLGAPTTASPGAAAVSPPSPTLPRKGGGGGARGNDNHQGGNGP